MRRIRKIVMVVVVVAVAVFIGSQRSNPKEIPMETKTVPAERGDLKITILTTGVVEPQNRLEIKPPIAGRIEEVLVREGELVKRGKILAWMSSTERAALLDAARAQGPEAVARWERVYKPTPLLAPLDGTIIRRAMEPGQTVTAQDAVFVLSDRLIVEAQVDETDIGKIRLAQEATVTLDAYPQEEIPAVVDHIAYEAQTVNNVTIYEVDVLPLVVPEFMRSGMTANVTFVVDSRQGVLMVPSEAVHREEGKMTVLAAPSSGSRPVSKTIQTGVTDGKQVEVLSGLTEGEGVVVKDFKSIPVSKKPLWSPFNPGARRRNPS